jgi:autotransporter-associated beta strand protein
MLNNRNFRVSLLASVAVMGLVAGAGSVTAAVIDYPNGSTNANPIVLTDNSTQLQVLTGSATQSGVISETGGSFGLSKIGAGTLSLTGANTYTGATTITTGTLQIGIGGTSGMVAGNITDNGALVFNRSDVAIYGGTISSIANGTFTDAGSGTLILTANSSVNGNITINSGATLQFGNGGAAGGLAGNITDNGALIINRSDAVSTGAVVSGTGSFTDAGTGVLTLTGNSTYTGTTTINAGATLNLGGGTANGAIAGTSPVVDNGSLVLNHSSIAGIQNTISGTGSVTAATGTHILIAANTYTGGTTINTGATLQVGNGGNAGAITGNVVDNGTLVFNRNSTVTYAGVISGTGGVTSNLGSGLTLTGNNTYTGLTDVGVNTLNIGGGGTSGSVAGTISARTLVFNRTDTITYNGILLATNVVAATGTTIITGNNSNTNSVVINPGAILQFGNGGTRGQVNGAITDNGTLVINRAGYAQDPADVISGTGGVTISGNSIAELRAANTYSGVTVIDSGSTVLLEGSINSSSAVIDNGILAPTGYPPQTISNNISGTGGLEVGILTILTGTNTYSGVTEALPNSTLQIGNGGTTGSIAGDLTAGGTVIFNRSDAYTYAGTIGGVGNVIDSGTGILTLTANSPFIGTTTINPGATLQLGNGGTTGMLARIIVDNGRLIFNRSDVATYTSNISGSGSVTQAGTGTLVVTGALTQAGGTILNSGSGLSVAAGGSLSAASAVTWALGTGTGTATITNAGTITGSTRAITTSGSGSPRSLNLTNSGTITGTGNDGVQIGNDIGAGTITVSNSGTIKSSGGQAIDFAAVTAGTATVNITNAAGAIITATADDALRPGAGTVSINNQGSITSTAAASRAINVNPTNLTNIAGFTIANGAAGNSAALIQSAGDAVRFTASTLGTTAAYTVALDNFGTIQSTGVGANNGQALDFNDLVATGGKITITNEAGGLIQAADADAIRPGANATVNNSGTIKALFSTASNASGNVSGNDAIDFQSGKGGVVNNLAGGTIDGAKGGITAKYAPVITNAGTIIGRDGSGINIDTARDATPANPDITATGTVTVVNTGTIIGTANTADGDAIDVDYLVNVTNSGIIKASGIVAPAVGSLNEALAIGGGTVTNQAGGQIVSDQRAITVDDSNKGNAFGAISIDNFGTIAGSDTASGGIGGIKITSIVSNSLINESGGVINGGVQMGQGDDSVTLFTGSTLNGLLDGSAGNDTLTLKGTGAGTFANVANFETLNVTGGNWTLGGTQAYATAVNVTGSTANVTGTLASALTIVGSGGTLTGTGKVGTTAVASGGAFAPGNGFTVNGNLTLASGANYIEALAPTTANLTTVTGTASLAGTFTASVAGGSYSATRKFTVLTASGGISGTFSPTSINAPAYVKPALSYDANNVYLTLTQVALGSLATNPGGDEKAVLAALDNAVAAGYVPTGGTLALYGLSGSALNAAADQISGQANVNASSAMGASFDAFLSLMTPGGDPASGNFAPGQAYNGDGAPARAQLGSGEMRVWGMVYGGTADLDANATTGAAAVSASNHGFAVGVDTKLDAGLLGGLTLGVGHQDFSAGNGAGNSDDVMLGGYLRQGIGNAYVAGSLAYGWHSITTSRTVTISGTDVLQARFNATDIGGRIEGGWNMSLNDVVLTPYGAWIHSSFTTPAYAEAAVSGAGTFALGFAEQSTGAGRTELGARLGRDFHWDDTGLTGALTAAWAHSLNDTPTLQAAFVGIPGSSFQVIGSQVAKDSALLGGSLQAESRNGLSYGVRLESQLGQGTTIFEGMGTLGWHW